MPQRHGKYVHLPDGRVIKHPRIPIAPALWVIVEFILAPFLLFAMVVGGLLLVARLPPERAVEILFPWGAIAFALGAMTISCISWALYRRMRRLHHQQITIDQARGPAGRARMATLSLATAAAPLILSGLGILLALWLVLR